MNGFGGGGGRLPEGGGEVLEANVRVRREAKGSDVVNAPCRRCEGDGVAGLDAWSTARSSMIAFLAVSRPVSCAARSCLEADDAALCYS